MTFGRWHAVCAAALAAAACAHGQSSEATMSPAAQQAAQAQSTSQQALSRANDAQKKASDQADKARKAQQDVQAAQRQLSEAQRTAEQEQRKAEQLQQAANEATQHAAQVAQQSQQQASSALQQEGQQVARGEQTLTGTIEQVQPGQIAVRPSGGHTMSFRVGAQTAVRVDGQEGTFSDVSQGENARVAYQLTGPTPTALSIDVIRNPGDSAAPQGGSSGSSAPSPAPQGPAGAGSGQ